MLIADGHFSVKVICSDYKLCLKFSIFLPVLDYFRCQILHWKCGVESGDPKGNTSRKSNITKCV